MKMAAFAKRWIWLAAALALAVSGCGGGSKSATPPRASVDTETSMSSTPTVSESTTSTSVATPSTMPEQHFEPLYADPALTPEEQVEAAYLFSWEIYYYAASRGDTTYIPLAYALNALEIVTAEVERYAANKQTQTGTADLNYGLDVYAEGEAVVVDFWNDNLTLVSLEDGREVSSGNGELTKNEFYFELIDGQWLVTAIIRRAD